MRTADFDYGLPPELIAQTPVEPRDHSRLMVVARDAGTLTHRRFCDLAEYLRPGDVLVANETRVLPARLYGRRGETGGRVELLLLRALAADTWETLARPARRLRVGERVQFEGGVSAEVVQLGEQGKRVVRFSDPAAIRALGTAPLPPYIHTPLANPERYQTVYARVEGSAAAPTAGLHFTPDLMASLQGMGVEMAFVTLHIGLDTFRPVEVEDPRQHHIHTEYAEVTAEVAERLNQARAAGRRVVAVGTTAVRTLETAARASSTPAAPARVIQPFQGWTNLFILPGFSFRAVDALITNFHLPRSTLLMLVAAFTGKDLLDRAYREAVAHHYRFYSFGDCQLIL